MRDSLELKSLAIAAAFLCCALGCQRESARYRRVAENDLRSSAVRIIIPAYPKASVASGTEGVAVADLELAEDGSVRSVNVLQAPDPAIVQEMTAALKGWKFAFPTPEGMAGLSVRGKVTHYFVIEAGNGLVLTPVEEAARRQRIARGGI